MDKEIPLARQEEKRRSVLLSSPGVGEDGEGTVYRDAREKAVSNAKRDKDGKISSAKKKSKSNAKAKRGGRERGIGPGPTHPSGGAVGELEDRNRSTRRSAKILEVAR